MFRVVLRPLRIEGRRIDDIFFCSLLEQRTNALSFDYSTTTTSYYYSKDGGAAGDVVIDVVVATTTSPFSSSSSSSFSSSASSAAVSKEEYESPLSRVSRNFISIPRFKASYLFAKFLYDIRSVFISPMVKCSWSALMK